MRTIITMVLGLLVSVSIAQEVIVATDAKTALKSCQEKAKSSPKELQEKMLQSCQCIVKNTDFEKAKELNKQGKSDELKVLYDEASKACSE